MTKEISLEIIDDEMFSSVGQTLTLMAGMSSSSTRRHMLMSGAAICQAIPMGKSLVQRFVSKRNDYPFSISLTSQDSLYPIVSEVLMDNVGISSFKNIRTSVNYEHVPGEDPLITLRKFATQSSSFKVNIEGIDAKISTQSGSGAGPSPMALDDDESDSQKKSPSLSSMRVSARTAKDRDRLLVYLEKLVAKRANNDPQKRSATSWGDFRSTGRVPKRTMESVVLKKGQAERIVADISSFLDNRELYSQIGIPWHRGILFEGPPGTGKSSLAMALSHEFKMDIYIINISSVEDDDALSDLMNNVQARSIVLLEDIDAIASARGRDSGTRVTTSGILNVLDGAMAPEGVLTILTTNDADAVDPAILRPGRVDLRERVDYIDNDQLHRLCSNILGYIPVGLPHVSRDDMISPADVVDCFKKHITNTDLAAADIVAMVESKKLREEAISA